MTVQGNAVLQNRGSRPCRLCKKSPIQAGNVLFYLRPCLRWSLWYSGSQHYPRLQWAWWGRTSPPCDSDETHQTPPRSRYERSLAPPYISSNDVALSNIQAGSYATWLQCKISLQVLIVCCDAFIPKNTWTHAATLLKYTTRSTENCDERYGSCGLNNSYHDIVHTSCMFQKDTGKVSL